jgi:hypothetical protein
MSDGNQLIIESHPENYDGYPFVTLIEHLGEHYLTIIDSINEKYIHTYVLDLCKPEGIDENKLIKIAEAWYATAKKDHPLSIEFSIKGYTESAEKVLRSFSLKFTTRCIGPVFYVNERLSSPSKRKLKSPFSTDSINCDNTLNALQRRIDNFKSFSSIAR